MLPLLLVAIGCAHNRPYRTASLPGCTQIAKDDCNVAVRHAIGDASTKPYITYVEFDEQGEMHERALVRSALAEISERARQRPTIMLLYAHGWKHNAEAKDSNVEEFQKQLKKLAYRVNINDKKPIHVEGIYLAWRGLSLKPRYIKETTFWARKRAAERIGRDGAAEVIAELSAIRGISPLHGYKRHSLVLSGHSMGAALVHSATSHMLLRELVQSEKCAKRPEAMTAQATMKLTPFEAIEVLPPPKPGLPAVPAGPAECRRLTTSVADLVMLINPAIEHARFSPIEIRASEIDFLPGQKPVFAVFMSKEDRATKWAFPLGRRTSTILNMYKDDRQRSRDRTAVGHLDNHWTHELSFAQLNAPVQAENPYKPFYESANGPALRWDQYVCGKASSWEAGNGVLTRMRGSKPFSPYMIVSVHGNGISSHNDIWTDQFTDFIERFVASGIQRPEVNCAAVPAV